MTIEYTDTPSTYKRLTAITCDMCGKRHIRADESISTSESWPIKDKVDKIEDKYHVIKAQVTIERRSDHSHPDMGGEGEHLHLDFCPECTVRFEKALRELGVEKAPQEYDW